MRPDRFMRTLSLRMTSEQAQEYQQRVKRGYKAHQFFTSRKTGNIAVGMQMTNQFGSFLICIYPDGEVEGGKMKSIPLRKEF